MYIKKIATVGIEPTTLALLAPRSNQTELYGLLIFYKIYILNVNISFPINKAIFQKKDFFLHFII